MIINNFIIKKFVCQKTIRENQCYSCFHFISVFSLYIREWLLVFIIRVIFKSL